MFLSELIISMFCVVKAFSHEMLLCLRHKVIFVAEKISINSSVYDELHCMLFMPQELPRMTLQPRKWMKSRNTWTLSKLRDHRLSTRMLSNMQMPDIQKEHQKNHQCFVGKNHWISILICARMKTQDIMTMLFL
ncbi:hypothetical protein RND81_01G127900 [Saponaria officinalis]|uniref:Uncharacterized protein n=1 Tax=Saponaria officinalis TaxID=3572 RepID=A0AAW1NDK8_SAPOF